MDYKKEIRTLLKSLKNRGFDRKYIENALGIAENGIDQALSRTPTEKLYKQVLLFNDYILLKNASIEKDQVIQEPEPEYGNVTERLLTQQNKLIDSMNKQSEVANSILNHLANNVESKVEVIDSNLNDALGRIESLKLDLRSGRNVVLKSLARLEKRTENSLVKEADSIILALMQEQSRKQNKKPGKGS